MTAREAVVHYVLFEHLQDGLVVVIISTISDLEGIDKNTHGFSKDGIPEAKDVVRIDMMGGFAIQKVTPERSYFRTIANMDLKLDFVPPSLMNFITRQLVGNGFRLYQKAVASVSNHDEDYSKALEAPMYARIREALYSTENANEAMEWKEPEADACLLQQEHSAEDIKEKLGDVEPNILGDNDASEASPENAQVVVNKSFGEIKEENSQESRHLKDESLGVMELNIHGDDGASEAFPDNAPAVMDNKSFGDFKEEKNPESRHLNDGMRGMEQRVHCNDHGNESGRNIALATGRKTFIEIEEEESEDSRRLMRDCRIIGQTSSNNISLKSPGNSTRNIRISSDVGRALETLEKAISMVREYGNSLTRSFSRKTNEENKNLEKDAENDPTHLQHSGGRSNAEVSVEASSKGKRVGRSSSRNSFSNREIRRAGSRETSHNKITPASPDQYISILSETNHVALYSSENGKDETTEVPAMDLTTQGDKQTSLEGKVSAPPNLPRKPTSDAGTVMPSLKTRRFWENKYEIEEDHNLEVKYKNWQKKLHPDLVHSKPEKEREFAAEQSARVIDAYRTLNDALSRAIYILKLEGVNVNEEETVSEPELLAEIMEIREAVEEAPDYQTLKEIQSLMQEKLQNWSNSFASAFRDHKFEEAKNCIRRMTYYDRVNEEIVKRL
ncbi:hypothetical protein NC651_016704 [Populus alba x Populus x berolinensis]|nr:hypothetical protein NC651_016704 [Populus alba x Populus x berolinensis]